MGFRVEVDEDSLEILKKFRSSPAEVFGKPYTGYLLFLVGGADEEIMNWLSKNIIALDSLTGDDVAFAIFARSFRMKLNVNMGGSAPHMNPHHQTKRRIDIPLNEIKAAGSITYLVKSGRCGWVLNGDEINVITYAVDDIAREFGVTSDLPCILILDAVPKDDFEIFHLTVENIQYLIPLLRRTIHSLLEMSDYDKFKTIIRRVIQLQNDALSIQGKINTLENKQDSIRYEPYIEQAHEILPEFRSALTAANLQKFISLSRKSWMEFVFDSEQLASALSSARKEYNLLAAYSRTIHRLYLFATEYHWPLEEPWLSNYLNVYKKYVNKLLKSSPEKPDVSSPEQCNFFRQQLINQQTLLVDELMNLLPNPEEIEIIAQNLVSKKKNELDEKLKELYEAKRGINLELKNSVKILYDTKQPSLIKSFAKVIKKERLTSLKGRVRDIAAAFAGSWLQPSTILETFKSMATT